MKSSYLLLFSQLLSYRSTAGFITPVSTSRRRIASTRRHQSSVTAFRGRATLLSAASHEKNENNLQEFSSSESKSPLDRVLDKLTLCFPLFVLLSVATGLIRPETLIWADEGIIIKSMLAFAMFVTGLTLRSKDFMEVFKEQFGSIPLGVLCQFTVMPLATMVVGRALFGPASIADATKTVIKIQKELYLGLCFLGSAPGATASNLVALVGNANVALSVLLTACSTIVSVFMSPLLVKMFVGKQTEVSIMSLVDATLRFILLPFLLGMKVRSQTPGMAKAINRFAPLFSALIVSFICGVTIAPYSNFLMSGGKTVLLALGSVVMLHMIGFDAGYLVAKTVLGEKNNSSSTQRMARTISLQVGMQNTAFAIFMAQSLGAPTLAFLPAILSAVVHPFLGSIVASIWKRRDRTEDDTKDSSNNSDETDYEI